MPIKMIPPLYEHQKTTIAENKKKCGLFTGTGTCKLCQVSFVRKVVDKRDKKKFCSSRCALNFVRTKKHQKEAGRKGAQAIIQKYRGTGTKGYIKENQENQHRVVMEKILKRKLRKGEIVHHIDGNKHNNDPKNLEVMTQSEHARIHMKLLKRDIYGHLQAPARHP